MELAFPVSGWGLGPEGRSSFSTGFLHPQQRGRGTFTISPRAGFSRLRRKPEGTQTSLPQCRARKKDSHPRLIANANANAPTSMATTTILHHDIFGMAPQRPAQRAVADALHITRKSAPHRGRKLGARRSCAGRAYRCGEARQLSGYWIASELPMGGMTRQRVDSA